MADHSHLVATRDIHLSPKRARRASSTKVEQYRRAMEAGRDFPPLVLVALPDGSYDVRDGRHRLLASLAVGFDSVEAIIR